MCYKELNRITKAMIGLSDMPFASERVAVLKATCKIIIPAFSRKLRAEPAVGVGGSSRYRLKSALFGANAGGTAEVCLSSHIVG